MQTQYYFISYEINNNTYTMFRDGAPLIDFKNHANSGNMIISSPINRRTESNAKVEYSANHRVDISVNGTNEFIIMFNQQTGFPCIISINNTWYPITNFR